MSKEYTGEERRNHTVNDRLVNDLITTVNQTRDTVFNVDKVLAVNIERQERFYERLDDLETHYKKLEDRQQVYEDRLQCIINKMNNIKWVVMSIFGIIITLIIWGNEIFTFVRNLAN